MLDRWFSRPRFTAALAAACLTGGLTAPLATAGAEEIHAKTAVLGWLDKITARVGEAHVTVGEQWELGSLSIIVRSCVRRVPPDDPESGAFLDISEVTEGEAAREVFRGWMYASSPALSAMDHGVYDVWVLSCEIPSDLEAGEATAPETPKGAAPAEGDSVPLD